MDPAFAPPVAAHSGMVLIAQRHSRSIADIDIPPTGLFGDGQGRHNLLDCCPARSDKLPLLPGLQNMALIESNAVSVSSEQKLLRVGSHEANLPAAKAVA